MSLVPNSNLQSTCFIAPVPFGFIQFSNPGPRSARNTFRLIIPRARSLGAHKEFCIFIPGNILSEKKNLVIRNV